jgi:hypothetical protein
MQLVYVRDHAKRRITVTTRGALTADDILAYIDQQVTEGTWEYAVLYDTGDTGSLPTPDDMDHVIHRVRTLATSLGRRGPVAIVSGSPTAVAAAREYAVVEHDVGAVGLFRDLDAAEQWLDQALNANRPPG